MTPEEFKKAQKEALNEWFGEFANIPITIIIFGAVFYWLLKQEWFHNHVNGIRDFLVGTWQFFSEVPEALWVFPIAFFILYLLWVLLVWLFK